jgi:UDP-GlcNAc:undecaprenyl-phosphate GlcNAc-1-phosphate transferase
VSLAIQLAGSAFLFALVITPLVRDVFKRLGVLDHPNGGRKKHSSPIPRVGGIAIALSMLFAVAVTAAFGEWSPFLPAPSTQLLIRLLPSAVIMFTVGLLDDFFTLRPWQKLSGQLIAATVAYLAGLRVIGFAGYSAQGWLTFPLTILWLILCANAFNLIDGIDGLAAGAGLFATLTVLLSGVVNKSTLVLAAVPLAGALLGFLRYNFNPATVFLGDSGSLLIGFLLGCFSAVWNFKGATMFGLTAPLMAMSVPLLDVTLSIIRRSLRGQPIFSADRGHVHHRLLDRGLTPRKAVLSLYGACAFGAALSILQTLFHNQYGGLVAGIFCIGTLIGVRHLGYPEFGIARTLFVTGALQRLVREQLQLRDLNARFDAAESFDACWQLVCDACREFGCTRVDFTYFDDSLREVFSLGGGWTLDVPIGERGALRIVVPARSAAVSLLLPDFVGLLSDKLDAKLSSFADRKISMAVAANSGL